MSSKELIGQTISHYEIQEELGRGGAAVVFKAHDFKLDRLVALKLMTLPGENDEVKRRFYREAKTASALIHPGICTVFDIDETEDGRLFIVMPYCEGESLKKILAAGALALESAIDIAIQVSEALFIAHEQGIIHRDVKPANIIINRNGKAMLLDFGLAKDALASSITRDGTVLGTAAFMSPEQVRGDEVDNRSDIWSLGVALYEMLTCQLPFSKEPLPALFASIMQDEPQSLRELRPTIPVALEQLVLKCLEKEPSRRFQSADELCGELRNRLRSLQQANSSDDCFSEHGISGNLKTVKLITVLEWLIVDGKSGTLVFDNGRVEKRIVIADKIVVSTASTDPREHLGHFLVSHGFITEIDLTRAMEMQQARGTLLGKNLIALSAISPDELERMLLLKAEETIYEIFAWTEGEFRFIGGEVPQQGMIPMTLHIVDLIAQAEPRREEWIEIRKVIPSPTAIPVSLSDLLADDDLDPDERLILGFVDDRNTIEEICLFAHSSEYHACRVLFKQWQANRIKVVQPRFQQRDDATPSGQVRAWVSLETARQRLSERDFHGTLRCLQAARSLESDNLEVRETIETTRSNLERELTREGMVRHAVPRLRVRLGELTNIELSPQEGFILSRINGHHDIESLLKISPIPPLEVLIVLWKLREAGYIELSIP